MGFGDKFKETMNDIGEVVSVLLRAPIQVAVEWGLETLLDTLGTRFAPTMAPLVKTLEDTGKVPPELEPILEEIKNPKGEIASLLSFAAARGGLGAVSGGVLTTLTAGLDYAIKAAIQPSLLDVKSIIDTERRVAGTEGFTSQEWLWSGFNEQRRELLREITRPLLGLEQLRSIYNRYPNAAGYIDNILKEYGFKEADISYLKITWYQYPGYQDLIRMAVREAFSPDIISEYQLGSDFPEGFAEEAAKQGLPREWAQRYWYAHWNLPSVTQAFEMFHRGVISAEELDTLLRTQDIMPHWRDKLTAIAYRPLTRVDVRRMHAYGTLSRDQVKRAYLDIGYNEENAELMTQFTIDYNQGSERDLTKTEILQLYKKGTLDYGDALNFLMELDYDQESAEWLLEDGQAAADGEIRDLTLSQVKNLYLAGFITQAEATGRLAKLNYSADDIGRLYNLWDLQAEPSVRMPSRTDLENFYKAGIINDDTWVDQMLLLGYTEDVIVWYYQLMNA